MDYWVNAVDDLWNDRNVKSLRVADHCDGKPATQAGHRFEYWSG